MKYYTYSIIGLNYSHARFFFPDASKKKSFNKKLLKCFVNTDKNSMCTYKLLLLMIYNLLKQE